MRQGLTIILSIITGILISLPVAFSFSPLLGLPLIAVFAAAGGLIGYKRRESDSFFYFALLCSIALLTMITYSSFQASQNEVGALKDGVPAASISN